MARGSCLCGSITYEAELPTDASGKPRAAHLCHCRMCRKITSAYTSSNIDMPFANFTLRTGTLKRIRTTHVDDQFEFSILFCPDCGSAIYAEPHIERLEGVVILQAGTLDEPVEILQMAPGKELNVKHRMGWMGRAEGAEQREGY